MKKKKKKKTGKEGKERVGERPIRNIKKNIYAFVNR
jgi:hypothetical protein